MLDDAAPDDIAPSSARGSAVLGPAVAVIQIRGLLCSEVSAFDCGFADGYSGDGSIIDQARQAEADPMICGVVWDILSPGGDALGLGECATQLAALRASSSKPWAVYARQALSAGYWLAAAAAGDGGLFVSESTDAANIGTWTAHTDYSKANEQEGVAITYVADPAGKVLGNPDEPLPEEARSRMMRGVADTTARFVAAVASYRPQLSIESLRALDGDTRRGAAAVEAGLADGLASSLDDVVALVSQRAAAMRPLAISPSPGLPPAPKGSTTMKLSAAVLAALPEAARASDAAAEAALLPILSFASAARAITGKDDIEAALGVLRANATLADEVPALRAKVNASNAAAEAAARVQKLEAAVKEGLLKPGEVWTWSEAKSAAGETESVRGIADVWGPPNAAGVGKTMAALDAELAHLRAVGPRTLAATTAEEAKEPSGQEAARQAAAASLDPNQLRFCQARGLDPAKFALLHASNFGAHPAAR